MIYKFNKNNQTAYKKINKILIQENEKYQYWKIKIMISTNIKRRIRNLLVFKND